MKEERTTIFVNERMEISIKWKMNHPRQIPQEIREIYEQQMELFIRGTLEELSTDIETLTALPPLISKYSRIRKAEIIAKERLLKDIQDRMF